MTAQTLRLITLTGMEATLIADVLLIMASGPLVQKQVPLGIEAFGWLIASYTVSAAIAELAFSHMLDRFTRRRALLFFYACFLSGVLATVLSRSAVTLFCARVICGSCGGIASVLVMAAIRDMLPEEYLGRGVGMVLTGSSIATVVVVPVGLILAQRQTWKEAFLGLFVAGLVVMVGCSAALWQSPAIYPPDRLEPGPAAPGLGWELFGSKTYLQTLGLVFLVSFSGYAVAPLFSTFLTECQPLATSQLPYFYFLAGLGTALLLHFTGALVDRFGRRRAFYGTQLLAIACVLLFTNGAKLPWFALCAISPVLLIVMSVRIVPAMAIVISSTRSGQRAGFLSMADAVHQLVAGVASVFGGCVAVSRGADLRHNYWILGLVFTLCAITAMVLVSLMSFPEAQSTGSSNAGRTARKSLSQS